MKTTFPKGSIICDRYIVEGLLGRGGSGAVYLVRDRRVKSNRFALKEVIDPSRQERQRFAFEGEVLKHLDHFALPRVYRVFEDEKNFRSYILMDYVQGSNLETLRQQQPEKRFPLAQVLKLMAPIVEAVTYLHEQQPPVVHRDIKPSNIVVPTEGGNAVLVDFGIAKEYEQDSTTTAVRHCSPGYGAPAQYARGTNPRTDIYGLAATFYTLLTGIIPVDAFFRLTQLGSKKQDPLVPADQLIADIPASVAEAIQRAMSINSEERFTSIQEFWQVLIAALDAMAAEGDNDDAEPESKAATEQEAAVEPVPVPVAQAVEKASPQTNPLPEYAAAAAVTVSVRRNTPLVRRGAVPLLLTVVAGLALLAGIVFSANVFSTPKSVVLHSQPAAAIHPPSSKRADSKPPTPTAATTPVATPPSLATSYNGTIHNQKAVVDSYMSLTQIHQSGTNITGYLALGRELLGDGPFSGTVTADRQIEFLVNFSPRYLPLLFHGRVNPDGSLSGSYCSAQDGQCNYQAGGYGTWQVARPQGT